MGWLNTAQRCVGVLYVVWSFAVMLKWAPVPPDYVVAATALCVFGGLLISDARGRGNG